MADHEAPGRRLAALRGSLCAWESRRHGRRAVPLGAPHLDAALGGGLECGTLHEVLAAEPGDDGAASGFALALALRCAEGRPFVWIVEDCAAREAGAPYRPGLACYGFHPDRLVLVRTADGRATLWAFEEALRMRAPVVLAELWGWKRYGLTPSRRLVLAAQAGGGTAVLLHAGLAGRAEALSSAARTRFSVAAHPSPYLPSAGRGPPIPGPPACAVRLLKPGLGRRFDDRIHPLVWNSAQRCFDDHPLRFGVSAVLADRPAQARRRRTAHG